MVAERELDTQEGKRDAGYEVSVRCLKLLGRCPDDKPSILPGRPLATACTVCLWTMGCSGSRYSCLSTSLHCLAGPILSSADPLYNLGPLQEQERVMKTFMNHLHLPVTVIDDSERMLGRLKVPRPSGTPGPCASWSSYGKEGNSKERQGSGSCKWEHKRGGSRQRC